MPPQPPSFSVHSNLLRNGIIAIAVLLAFGIGGYFLWKHSSPPAAIVPETAATSTVPAVITFAFHDGAISWYRLDDSAAVPLLAPILSTSETAASKAVNGPGITIQTVVQGPGNIVAYSYSDGKAIANAAKTGKPILADAPNSPGWPYALSIFDASNASSTPISLGAGYDGTFTSGGVLVALAPEGVSSYNTLTGARQLLIPAQNIDIAEFAISPTGAYAVIPNVLAKSLDVFSIGASAYGSSYIASIPLASSTAVAFVGTDRFILKTAPDSGTFYTVTSKSVDKGNTVMLPTP